jgi:hypothetical protein
VPALAQGPALTNYPACTGKPSAQDSEAAHSSFLLGQRFFNEADYGSALHNFVDAYKIDCTKNDLLIAIARANELSGNKADAVHALETYLQRSQTLAADDKAQIQKRIDNLKSQIASQSPATTVAPTPIVPTAIVPLPPPAPVAPPPTPAEERQHTAVPWVVAGVGGAAAVAGIVILLVGYAQYTSDECNGTPTCPKGSPNIAAGNSALGLEHAGVGVLIGGGAVAAAGLIWHFVEPTGPGGDKKAGWEPSLGPGYVGVTGRF